MALFLPHFCFFHFQEFAGAKSGKLLSGES